MVSYSTMLMSCYPRQVGSIDEKQIFSEPYDQFRGHCR